MLILNVFTRLFFKNEENLNQPRIRFRKWEGAHVPTWCIRFFKEILLILLKKVNDSCILESLSYVNAFLCFVVVVVVFLCNL